LGMVAGSLVPQWFEDCNRSAHLSGGAAQAGAVGIQETI